MALGNHDNVMTIALWALVLEMDGVRKMIRCSVAHCQQNFKSCAEVHVTPREKCLPQHGDTPDRLVSNLHGEMKHVAVGSQGSRKALEG